MPWLGLRRFTPAESEAAYAIAQRGPGRRCPAPWARLAPATRELLRHPLMLALFHTACAGMEQPPSLTSTAALWDAWLARTFDPAQGGAQLQTLALDLADACLDGGHDAIPAALAETWRERWQAALGHDPVRIAAGLDPLERLVEAGLLRRTETGGLDWVSDALAEQVLFLALHRRDPALGEASFRAWLALPVSRRLDGALGRVGAAIWRSGRPLAVRPVLDVSYRRSRALLADLLLDVIPRGLPAEMAQPVAAFAADLGRLVDGCLGDGNRRRMNRLKDGLLYDLDQRLADRWGYLPVRREIARSALTLAEHLGALEPDNTKYLRDLSISFHKLADLDRRTDPAAARAGYTQGLAIRSYNKLSEWMLEQGETATSEKYANKASDWMERAAAQNPEDSGIQYNLACTRARLSRIEEALAALARSVELGNTDADETTEDPDLRLLRGLPEFEALLARMRSNAT